jgi:hypothetical protein
MAKGRTFGFSRLLLLIGGSFGIWGFFQPFYQSVPFYTRPSGFEISQQFTQLLRFGEGEGFVFDLLKNTFSNELLIQIPAILLLIIPIIFGFITLEIFLRVFILRLKVVHKVWHFITLSLIGIIAGFLISNQQTEFEFYFFESIQSGYWKFLTMTVFTLLAKFAD